jgi:NADH-quinone oxidoreductase subunit N
MSTVVKTAGFAAFLRLFMTCFSPLADFWVPTIIVITSLTLFIGNITALYQTSFKRMLAYSSISHAGYLLFAIIGLGNTAVNAVLVYSTAYTIASIIAFAVLILVKRQMGNDSYDSFNGLAKKNPFLAFTLTIAMLSLAGIPLTAGFIGKFFMFTSAVSQYQLWLVVIAIINAIIGIFYYFRVILSMYFKDGNAIVLFTPIQFKMVLAVSAILTLVFGLYPSLISNLF